MKFMRSNVSYANVMSTLAVFLAAGGASYAALSLPRNSVGTAQLRNRAVTVAKLARGAALADHKAIMYTAPIPGFSGCTGSCGSGPVPSVPSPTTPSGAYPHFNPANTDGGVQCPPGQTVLSGGYVLKPHTTIVESGPAKFPWVERRERRAAQGWFVEAYTTLPSGTPSVGTVIVLCLK